MFAFLIALIGVFGLVAFRRATDAGAKERRALTPHYGDLFEAFAEFEKAGGRAHDLEWESAGHTSPQFRRAMGRGWLGSFVMTIALTMLWYLIELPLWIWLGLVAVYSIAVSLVAEFYLDSVGASTAGVRGARGIVFLIIGAVARTIVLVVAVVALWFGAVSFGQGNWLLGGVLAVGSVMLADIAHVPARWAESVGRRRRRVGFAADSDRDTVLYLRSFRDDRKQIYSLMSPVGYTYRLIPGRNRIEEILSSLYAGQSTTVVCIGRPGERAPSLGAGRTYWTDETWQSAVQQTAARASAIVLMAGSTQGLAWEVAQLKEMNLLVKLLILLPADTPEESWIRYRTIVDQLDVPTSQRLPHVLGVLSLPALCFAEDGSPVHLAAAGRNWLSYMMAILRFQRSLSGSHRLDKEGSFAKTMDPVNLVQYAVKTDGFVGAHELVELLDDSARLRLARAWLALADSHDAHRAGQLTEEGLRDYPGEESLMFAAGLLDRWDPDTHPDEILGDSQQCREPPTKQRVEITAAPRSLWRWPYVHGKAEEALTAEDFDAAWTHAGKGAEIAQRAGAPTAEAYSEIHRIRVMIHRGELKDAAHAAENILNRSDLTDLQLAPALKLEKWDVQDDALGALVDIAAKRGSLDERVRAIERVRAHRVLSGQRELAAYTAGALADLLIDHDRPDEAERWAHAAANEFQSLGRTGDHAQALVLLCRAQVGRDECAEAVETAVKASRLAESANALEEMFQAYHWHGQALYRRAEVTERAELYADAAEVYRKLREWVADGHDDQDPGGLQTAGCLSDALYFGGKPDEALAVQRDLADRADAALGVTNNRAIRAHRVLAYRLEEAGGPAEALIVQLEVHRRLVDRYGPDYEETLAVARSIADLQDSLGRPADVAVWRAEIARSVGRMSGENSSQALAEYGQQAIALREAGQLSESRDRLREALERNARRTEPDDELAASLLSSLAATYDALGQLGAAAEAFREAQRRRRMRFGPRDLYAIEIGEPLVSALFRAGHLDEALAAQIKMVEEIERVLGGEAPKAMEARDDLTRLAADVARARRAEGPG